MPAAASLIAERLGAEGDRTLIDRTRFAISTEETRYYLNGVYMHVAEGEGTPAQIVEARGLAVVSDEGVLISAIDDAMAQMPDVVEKVKGGKVQAVGALIGPVMKATKGQADAGRVRELILEKLGVS